MVVGKSIAPMFIMAGGGAKTINRTAIYKNCTAVFENNTAICTNCSVMMSIHLGFKVMRV